VARTLKFIVYLQTDLPKEKLVNIVEEIKQKLTENEIVCTHVERVKSEYRRLDD
jgi:hypothetical protein